MELKRFKTLWGHEGPLTEAIAQVKEAGFSGIEAPVPDSGKGAAAFGEALAENNLLWIQEICTAGGYVPRRHATIEEHLEDFEEKILSASGTGLKPQFVNIMGGCDAWTIEDSVRFFSEAQDIADRHNVLASFETHRGRSFFSPWNTVAILEKVPHIEVTCDFSHWAVVEYADALASHQACWEAVWESQMKRGVKVTTMTPEFGTDGYLHMLPFTKAPIADLWSLNRWIGEEELAHFQRWQSSATRKTKIA